MSELAGYLSEKLRAYCMAYNFVYIGDKPLIAEISYSFIQEEYDALSGYWDKNRNWHPSKIVPQAWMGELMFI